MFRCKYRLADNVVTGLSRGVAAGAFDDVDHGTTIEFSMINPPDPYTVIYNEAGSSLDPYVDLDYEKSQKTLELDRYTFGFIESYIPAAKMTALLVLLDEGRVNNWANRIIAVEAFRTWVYIVLDSRDTVEDAITAASDKSTLDALVLDFSSHSATVPNATVRSVRGIVD